MRKSGSVRIAFGVVALLVAGGLAAPAQAQYVAELTPYFVSYYPLTKITDAYGGDPTLSERQLAGPGVGARLTFWLSNTIGIEAAGSMVWSGTRFTSTDNQGVGVSLAGTLINANGRVLFRPARTNFFLLVGGGMVSRGGDTWDFPFITKKTTFGGVAGLGARANITPKLGLLVTVEGVFYQLDPDGDTGTVYDGKLQSDIHVTVGIPIGFGRR